MTLQSRNSDVSYNYSAATHSLSYLSSLSNVAQMIAATGSAAKDDE